MAGTFAVVAFCALQVFQSWQALDRPLIVENPLDLFFMVLLAVGSLKLLAIFKGPRERFLVGVAIMTLARGIATSFHNPLASLVKHAFIVLWFLALLMSLSMFIWPPQLPRIEVKTGEIKHRMLILFAVAIGALVLGALIYFVPFR